MPKPSPLQAARAAALLAIIERKGCLSLCWAGFDSLSQCGFTRSEAQRLIDVLSAEGKVEIRLSGEYVDVVPVDQGVAA